MEVIIMKKGILATESNPVDYQSSSIVNAMLNSKYDKKALASLKKAYPDYDWREAGVQDLVKSTVDADLIILSRNAIAYEKQIKTANPDVEVKALQNT
ncbi:hypothetical protein FD09_GL002121 [Schleiferilactobacillus perolens DSM 12744]|uniref:Fe/B12 periplasmic-binding domain-containing protein n=2 Tax=Schleiferilactobacillus perolens TaxID=100468 RepID=A0A0R1MYS3_9LACO|nr:hypothetical protein FD09_GL002121 [Schleiferilactobacillus perolens DSM 12744]